MANVLGFLNNVKNRLLFAVGYVILQVARPSCEYTARLTSKDTSLLIRDQSFEISQERDKIVTAIKQHVDMRVAEVKHYLDAQLVQIKEHSVSKQEYSTRSDVINSTLLELEQAINELDKPTNELDMFMIKDAINENHLTEIKNNIGELPTAVDKIVKKYSMHLHEEHVQMFEAIEKAR